MNQQRQNNRIQRFALFASPLFCGLAFFLCATILLPVAKDGVHSQSIEWPEIILEQMSYSASAPMQLLHAGDGSGRIFIVERAGTVRIVEDGKVLPEPFLDIRERVSTYKESGLLSIAFPPDFVSSRVFYAYYSSNTERITDPAIEIPKDEQDGKDSVIARFRLTDNDDVASPAEEVVMLIDQPYGNHNGGQIAFGPDGYLYIGLGDGGSGGDPLNAGQRGDLLLGKILRIAVSDTGTYTIPLDNPFVGDPSMLDEVWALGVRNPWRFGFDSQTGDLYIGDVGQGALEEVDFQAASSSGGENYGWKIMEGTTCYNSSTCDKSGLTLPIHDYGRLEGDRSITGGTVYRGSEYPRMQGIYIYGDFVSGRVWGLRRNGSSWENYPFLDTDYSISAFGEDETGALYLLHIGGEIFKLTDMTTLTPMPTTAATSTPIPGTGTAPFPTPKSLIYFPYIDQ